MKQFPMRDRLLRFVIVVSVMMGACTIAGRAQHVKALAAAVDAHYNHLRTLQAEFTELYRGSGMERTETGTLWLKKPGKMRWEYRSPKEKLFVSDGKDAWFYVPDDRQARKESAKKLDDVRSPLAFLLGKSQLEKELQGLSLAPDVPPLQPGNVVLRGVPEALGGSGQRDCAGDDAGPPDRADCGPGCGWSVDRIPLCGSERRCERGGFAVCSLSLRRGPRLPRASWGSRCSVWRHAGSSLRSE